MPTNYAKLLRWGQGHLEKGQGHVESELSGNFLDTCKCLMMGPSEFDAYQLCKAIKVRSRSRGECKCLMMGPSEFDAYQLCKAIKVRSRSCGEWIKWQLSGHVQMSDDRAIQVWHLLTRQSYKGKVKVMWRVQSLCHICKLFIMAHKPFYFDTFQVWKLL